MGPRHGTHRSPVHGEHGTELTPIGPTPIVGGVLLGPDPLHPPSTSTATSARTTNRIMCLSAHPDGTPNTADQLRSGAPVHPAGGGTGRHLVLPFGCRPELRQLHPLVRQLLRSPRAPWPGCAGPYAARQRDAPVGMEWYRQSPTDRYTDRDATQ